MKILIIEDDSRIRELLEKYFSNIDCEVEFADSGREALELIIHNSSNRQREEQFNVVILDWLLGNEDGLAVGKRIRAISSIPIIMLSVKCDKKDIVKALDSGIDDYMTKPFSLSELEARVRKLAVKNRELIFKSTGIKMAGITLDLKQKAVITDDQVVSLSITEYRILICLLLRQDEVVSIEEIKEHVYDRGKRPGRHIEAHIANLRKKLPANIEIRAVSGQGYTIKKK